MSDGPLVLVVDDELQIRRFLRISLERTATASMKVRPARMRWPRRPSSAPT